ncbi:glycosyltransferase family 4 protein [Phragmitibacter flavus]|uniref:Glycosyltransferase family 4 protein n=1 Tax=Phragmitibacter flavus TaxID=2576071 RepID=A0A5R8KDE0_9BACT|nr:glycosyltransferase family 4 protein [Phragmitibacter flavus]TLD69935.1 glycosyltransferase family 4 protein [Phragmitibacter flavus]
MRILFLNQCFHPDEVATAVYLKQLATELVRKGHEVTVIASNRGYNHPEVHYPSRENWMGIEIRRIWTPGLGKRSIWRRVVDSGVFWLNAARMLVFASKPDVIVSLTSPPLISVLGALAARWHGCRSMIWLMDMNPDQAVANGVFRQGSWIERSLSTLLNWSFHQATRIVVLDRFMAQRLRDKGVADEAIRVEPPWANDHELRIDETGRAEFRSEHGLPDKFVVMYSGNHSPCHPLDTLLEATLRLRERSELCFLFVGDGSEHRKVKLFAEQHQLRNILCLPYQPLERLSASLSAADLHLVVMGDLYVGIVHPCKIYNILSLGLPFLFVGPSPSHGSDMVDALNLPKYARRTGHGDIDNMVKCLEKALVLGPCPPSVELQHYSSQFAFKNLCPRLVAEIEAMAMKL